MDSNNNQPNNQTISHIKNKLITPSRQNPADMLLPLSASTILSPCALRRLPMAAAGISAAATTVTGNSDGELSPENTRIGWIGTGVMGRYMCGHLIRAGYRVTVFNRTAIKASPLIEMGARSASSPASVAASSDVVFSMVGFPADVRATVLHPSTGVIAALGRGGVVVDMTTSEPSLAVEIASSAASRGCAAVDAPVSGGDRGAKDGTLAIFAGGDSTVVSRLEPLFKEMGRVSYMGGAGKGQCAKLANQITIASTMVGMVEGMLYAQRSGLEVEKYVNTISGGAAGSKSLELYGGRIVERDFKAGFYVNHFVKDMGICLRECERMGVSLPGLALSQQLYLSLVAHGEGSLGTHALILALERLNNVH